MLCIFGTMLLTSELQERPRWSPRGPPRPGCLPRRQSYCGRGSISFAKYSGLATLTATTVLTRKSCVPLLTSWASSKTTPSGRRKTLR